MPMLASNKIQATSAPLPAEKMTSNYTYTKTKKYVWNWITSLPTTTSDISRSSPLIDVRVRFLKTWLILSDVMKLLLTVIEGKSWSKGK